jgi:uncharacterized paraquat-inducible protein A
VELLKVAVTDLEQAKHLAIRQKRAEQIIYELDQFKVCDQCRSISYKQASTCPVCGAYRFSEDREFVQETAKEMGRNPFPITSGTVPRI